MQSLFEQEQPEDDGLDEGVAASIGFDPDINKDLMWPSPPRRTPILRKSDALERIDKHLADLQQVCSLKGRGSSLCCVLDFLAGFNSGSPGILARSRMFLSLWESDVMFGKIDTIDLILQSAFEPLGHTPPRLQDQEAYDVRLRFHVACFSCAQSASLAYQFIH